MTAGCQVFPHTDTEPSKQGWEHSNLYNPRAPYPKLFVEIDAVEGTGPTPTELRALEEFLQRHCDKPDGIRLKIDSMIPRRVAMGRSAESLALEYVQGPPDERSAFLYLLFYNGRWRGSDAKSENPAFTPQPFPIIWIDRSYRMLGNPYGGTFARAVLLHETGHALGLCATDNHHGKEGHCTNEACVMSSAINFQIRRFLTLRNPWTNTTLCQDCTDELARNKAATANAKFDFWRGYFRRKEDGYQVLGLPSLTYVNFGEPLAEPPEDLVQLRRELMSEMARGESLGRWTVRRFDPWENFAAFNRFTREKNDQVRAIARRVFDSIVVELEEHADTESARILELLTDEFIAAAQDFPEQHEKLVAIREEASAPAGYGARLSAVPPRQGSGN